MTPPSIHLDPVRFEDGKLWKARYPSLIDYDQAPGLQFEPAFHVFSEKMEVIFRIADDQDAEFVALGEAVRFDRLTPPFDPPVDDVSVTLVTEGDLRACRVEWKRTGTRLTALRIVCRHVVGGPQPETDAWALTQVEGGIYLVLIDRGEPRRNSSPVLRGDRQRRSPDRVRVVGIDANSRPVYDLFREDFIEGLSQKLSVEPAFRAGHGERLDFKLALELPPGPYADTCFKAEDGQVTMSYAVPSLRPESLIGSPASEEGRVCCVQWHHPALSQCVTGSVAAGSVPCREGRTANLYAQVEGSRALESVDPTVIEPPACDASGVCTRPRDRGEEGT